MRAHWLLLAGAACWAAGCESAASPYRLVLRDQTAAFEETERILADVKDADTMAAAKGKLQERAGTFEDIARRGKRLAEPSREVREQLAEDAVKLDQARRRMQAQVRRIVALPGGSEFLTQFPNFRGFLPQEAP